MLNADLSIRDFDGQAVVALRGEFNLADIPGVTSHLIAAVAACGPSVIVDLAGLEGISYSGLSMLLRMWKWTRRSGGDLPPAGPPPAGPPHSGAPCPLHSFPCHSHPATAP